MAMVVLLLVNTIIPLCSGIGKQTKIFAVCQWIPVRLRCGASI
jgi:hypothetical protein